MNLGKQPYMDNDTYHSHKDFTSSSGLVRLIQDTPAHHKHYIENKNEPTDAMKFGTAAHMAVLEVEKFKTTYIQKPDGMSFATKEGKAWREENQGKEILSFDDYNAIRGIYSAVMAHGKARELLSGGEAEQSYFWADKGTGVKLRCRPDYMTGNVIVDFKTTESASPHKFQHSINKYRYDIQAAHYLRGLTEINKEHYNFVFIVVEKTAPYAVALYELDNETLFRADGAITSALHTLKDCQETNNFPGYSSDIQKIGAQYFGL